MADKIPVKARYSGSDVVSLGELEAGDTINASYISGLSSGGGSGYSSVETKTADYTIVAGDSGKLIKMSTANNFIPTAAATLGSEFSVTLQNTNTAPTTVTINPGVEKINDWYFIELLAGEIGNLTTDGTDWWWNSLNFQFIKPVIWSTSSAQSDVTGDGTWFTHAPLSVTKQYGDCMNATTGVWTCPVPGIYHLGIANAASQFDNSHTRYAVQIATTDVNYNTHELDPGTGGYSTNNSAIRTYGAIRIAMDKGDVASFKFMVDGGSKVIDVTSSRIFVSLVSRTTDI